MRTESNTIFKPHLMVGDYHPVENPHICYIGGGHQGNPPSGGQGGDSGNQSQGNQNQGTGDSGTGEDNTGQDDIYSQLFNDQSGNSVSQNGNKNPSPSSGSDSSTGNQNQTQNQNNNNDNVTRQLDAWAGSLNFGEGFSQESYEQFVNGDVKGFNAMLQDHGRSIVKQIFPVVAQMMQHLQRSMTEATTPEVQRMIDQAFESRKTNEEVVGAFGFENNPAMQRISMEIYKSVLPKVGNNKQKAIETTKQMLTRMNEDLNRAINIGNPPDGMPMNMGSEDSDFSALFGSLPKT